MWEIHLSKCIKGMRLEGYSRWDAHFNCGQLELMHQRLFWDLTKTEGAHSYMSGGGGGGGNWGSGGLLAPSGQVSLMLYHLWNSSDHWTKRITLTGLWLHWRDLTTMPPAWTPVWGPPKGPRYCVSEELEFTHSTRSSGHVYAARVSFSEQQWQQQLMGTKHSGSGSLGGGLHNFYHWILTINPIKEIV